MASRDDFPKRIKRAVSLRVGTQCSNPDCPQPTHGPHSDPEKFVNLGEAAHITAAAPGGPRYNAALTATQRKSADNAIWLCRPCAKMIDTDAARYPESLLREWKQQAEAKAFGRAGPPVALFTVPFPEDPDFVGRDEDLNRLHAALTQDTQVGIRPAGLTGMGGIGKTALAVRYAYQHRGDYPGGVIWINAAQALLDELGQLACLMQSALANRPLSEQVAAAFAELQTRGAETLIVFDNIAEPNDLNRPVTAHFVPTSLPCRILFTTRQRHLGRFTSVEVEVLREEPALQLLLRHPDRHGVFADPQHPDRPHARAIARMLGYLPLALELAGAFLNEWPEVTLGDYRERLKANGRLATLDSEAAELSNVNLSGIHEAAVDVTLTQQWECVTDEAARLLLRVAGQCPEAALIPVVRLGLLSGVSDSGSAGKPSPLSRGLRRLDAASLVEELRDDRLRLHPLIREFAARQTLMDEQEFRHACAVNLAARLVDPDELIQQILRRGVDEVILDSFVGVAFARKATPISEELTELASRLRREARHLREGASSPIFIGQQIHNRDVSMGQNKMARKWSDNLNRRACQWIRLKWQASCESLQLDCTLSRHEGVGVVVAVTPDAGRAISVSSQTIMVWDLAQAKLFRTLTDSECTFYKVVITPDFQRAVSASMDTTLKVWDLARGELLHTLAGRVTLRFDPVAITPNAARAVSASENHMLQVWDLARGELLHTLAGHVDRVQVVVLTPDGLRAVSASDDQTLKVWDLTQGKLLHTLPAPKYGIRFHRRFVVAVTPDGQRMVSASQEGTLNVWNLTRGELLYTLAIRPFSASAMMAFTPDGQRGVYASCHNATLKVWNLERGELLHTLAGHEGEITAIAMTADGEQLVSASRDHTLKVWDLERGELLHTLAGHEGAVNSVAVTPDGARAISSSNTLKVWDLKQGELQHAPSGHTRGVSAFAVTPNGKQLVSASRDHTLKVWDLERSELLHTLAGHEGEITAIVMTADGELVSASRDHTLKVWDLGRGELLFTLNGHKDSVNDLAISPDGQWVVSASSDNTLKTWDLEWGRVLNTMIGHKLRINAVAVTPDGQRVVSASGFHTVKVWDSTRGELLHTFGGHSAGVDAIAVTPDGHRLISVSSQTIMVWDLARAKLLYTLAGHDDRVNTVAMTPDGQRVVSSSDDTTLKVWDLVWGRELHTLAGHEDEVDAVAITPDGQVVSASKDKTLKVWDLAGGELLATLAMDSGVYAIALIPGSAKFVAGDRAGAVAIYELIGF